MYSLHFSPLLTNDVSMNDMDDDLPNFDFLSSTSNSEDIESEMLDVAIQRSLQPEENSQQIEYVLKHA